MPEIFRFYGFSFFFYSREHEPLHIHVEKQGIKANDYKKIKKMIDENADIIVKRWKEYFEK